MVIYVLTIAACSLGLGYATNLFYSYYSTSQLFSVIQKSENQVHGLIYYLPAIVLGAFIFFNQIRKIFR